MKIAEAPSRYLSSAASEATKAALREDFEQFLGQLSQPQLEALAEGDCFEALRATLLRPSQQPASPQVRNQLAYAKGKALAFEQICNGYELLDSKTVCALLGITRQALNKRLLQGQVLAYSEGPRKHYPAFQFIDNAVLPEVAELVRVLAIEPREAAQVNLLLGFLLQDMDYVNLGEPAHIRPRYQLLDEPGAFAIIVRDFTNRLQMGR
ncbi:hypothetical protein [Pseudomonas sp. NPDC089406]|uniref:hypothetical protein n=1 Tax=Pseudomonas sp. NPDC089406 TaxID=3364463 RepID=UPI00384E82FF